MSKKIIHGLLDQRLIACASIFPEVESIYRWDEKIEESQEIKIILKTSVNHFEPVQSYIQSHCSYEVPEILQVDIVQGNPRYMSWVVQETAFIENWLLAGVADMQPSYLNLCTEFYDLTKPEAGFSH